MIKLRIAALLVVIMPLVAAAAAKQAGQATPLVIENAWVRALPPAQPSTAGYLTLVNNGDKTIVIVSASADVAEQVEIHTTRSADGLTRMQQLLGLDLAPGERLDLAPGGTHLMLLGLEKMPVPSDRVQLCLQLASKSEVCTLAEVRKNSGASGSQHQQQHQH